MQRSARSPGVMSARFMADSRQLSAVGVGRGIKLVHHAARLLHGDGDLALLVVPVLVEDVVVLGLEGVEPAFFLQGDFELREIEVPRVAQALEEEPVHDLGDALVAGADAAVGGDVEDHRLGGDVLADVGQQHLDLWIAAPLAEQLAGALAEDVAVLRGRARGTWRSWTYRSRRSPRPRRRCLRGASARWSRSSGRRPRGSGRGWSR